MEGFMTLEEMQKALKGKKFGIILEVLSSGDYYLRLSPDDGSKQQYAVVPADYQFKEQVCVSSQPKPQTSPAIKNWLSSLPPKA